MFKPYLPVTSILVAMSAPSPVWAGPGEFEDKLDIKVPGVFLPYLEDSVVVFRVLDRNTEKSRSFLHTFDSDFKPLKDWQFPNRIALDSVGIQSNDDFLITGKRPLNDLEHNARKDPFQYGMGRVSSTGKLLIDLSLKDLAKTVGGQVTRLDHLHVSPDGTLTTATNQKKSKRGSAELTRFVPAGNIDEGFKKSIINRPGDFILQDSGKMIIALNVAAEENTLQQLTPQGQVDPDYSPGVDPNERLAVRKRTIRKGTGFGGQISNVVQQPDGKLLVAGILSLSEIQEEYSLVRLNLDGSVDATFTPVKAQVRGGGGVTYIQSLTLQTDGKILVNGPFKTLQNERSSGFARLMPDGSFDKTFDPPSEIQPGAFVLFPNGKILVGHQHLYRLSNDPAESSLAGKPDTGFIWKRSGASPEIERAFIEVKIGEQWNYHSEMQRTDGGWKSTRAVPDGHIRVCGIARGSLRQHFYTIKEEL